MKVLLCLVPFAGLAGCANANWGTQADYEQAMYGIQRSNAQMQQTLAQQNQMLQNNNAAMAQSIGSGTTTPDSYSYQRSDGVWVYCNKTSSYTVNCRTQ